MMKQGGVASAMALIFLLALSAIVKADGPPGPHEEHPEDFPLHEQFYAEWLMPNNGQPRKSSCCNKNDCYPTSFKLVGGTWFARRREDGKMMAVPDSKLEHLQPDFRESPDGQGHVCASAPYAESPDFYSVYCAVLGEGV